LEGEEEKSCEVWRRTDPPVRQRANLSVSVQPFGRARVIGTKPIFLGQVCVFKRT